MAKTEKQPAPANGVIDIPHEEMPDFGPMTPTPKTELSARLLTPEETAQQEIKKFNLADSAIEALKEKYGALTISGPEDKEGYKAVREAWSDTRSRRTGLEKKGKQIRDDYNFITKRVIKEEDRLVDLIRPLEDDLYQKWKAIDEEKERLQKEKEEAENRTFMNRLEILQGFGMVLEGGFYDIGGAISLDAATLRSMPEERFLALKAKAEKIFQDEKAIQAAAAFEREQKEKEMTRQREQFEADQRELKRQQEEMKADRERLESEKRQNELILLDNRINKLLSFGMQKSGNDLRFVGDGADITVISQTLTQMKETVFIDLCDGIVDAIKESKNKQAKREAEAKAEAVAKEQKERFIAETLEAAGFKYEYSKKIFYFRNEIDSMEVRFGDFEKLNFDEIEDWADGRAQAINNWKVKAQEAEEKRAAEADRQAKLGMKDFERFKLAVAELENALLKIIPSEFKTDKFQKKAETLYDQIADVLKKY